MQPGAQKVEVPGEQIVGEVGEAAREREDRDPEDHAWDHERREHHQRDQLLAAKPRAFEQERIAGADEYREQRDPKGDEAARCDAAHQFGVLKKSDPASPRAAGEPIERESAPRRRGIRRIVEGEYRDDGERQEQEREKRGEVDERRAAQPKRAGQGGNHALRITSPKRWPLRRSPTMTIAVERPSSRKPKAAPCSQLKRVMNCV